ncbi:hypothetical protein H1R20_g13916, partial [Candolleomyces eurysporus]
MIIFRVTTGRFFTKFPSVQDDVLTSPIQFAPQTAESSFLQSTSNREFGQNHDPDLKRELDGSIGEPTQTQPQASIIHIARKKWYDSGDVEKVG